MPAGLSGVPAAAHKGRGPKEEVTDSGRRYRRKADRSNAWARTKNAVAVND